MSDLEGLIREERIISLSYDKEHLQKVLDEILTLFTNQQKRINDLEEKQENYATKEMHRLLSDEVGELQQEKMKELEKINEEIKKFQNSVDKKLEEIRKENEDNATQLFADAHTMIATEIEKFSPAFQQEKPPLEEKFSELEEKLKKIEESVNGSSSLNRDGNGANGDLGSRVSEIEIMLKTYPNVETDVNNLVLQLPTITKRIEKKVNDVINVVENFKFSNNITRQQLEEHKEQLKLHQKQITNSLPVFPNSPLKPPINMQETHNGQNDKSDEESEDVFVLKSNKKLPPLEALKDKEKDDENNENENKEEEEDLFEKAEIKPIEKVEIDQLDDIKPMESSTQLQENRNGSIPLLDEYIKSRRSNDDPFTIDVDQHGNKVEIHETHTYQTQMQSSMRIVSDIEWLKAAINQHHEAIRQVQQAARVAQDNIETMNDNIVRSLTSQNAKISQIAQQNHSMKEEQEKMKQSSKESINSLQGRVIVVDGKCNELMNLQNEIDLLKEQINELTMHKQGHDTPKSRYIRKKLDTLPALPANIQPDALIPRNTQRSEYETERSEKQTENSTGKIQNSAATTTRKESSRDSTPQKSTRSFTFTSTHFSTNDDSNYSITHIDQRDNTNRVQTNAFSHLDLTSIPPISTNSPQRRIIKLPTMQHVQKSKPTPDSKGNYYDDLESPPSKETVERTKTIIMNDSRKYKMSNYQQNERNLTPDDVNHLVDQYTEDIVFDKVGKEARRVISELASSINDAVKEQLDDMRKDVNQYASLVDNKVDRSFVEKMFNKFRIMMKELNDKVDDISYSFLNWVTRDELEMVLQRFMNLLNNKSDTCGTTSKFTCLLCGRPKAHLSGMIKESEQHSSLISSSPSPMSKSKPTTGIKRSSVPKAQFPKVSQTKPNSPDKPHAHDVVQLLTGI